MLATLGAGVAGASGAYLLGPAQAAAHAAAVSATAATAVPPNITMLSSYADPTGKAAADTGIINAWNAVQAAGGGVLLVDGVFKVAGNLFIQNSTAPILVLGRGGRPSSASEFVFSGSTGFGTTGLAPTMAPSLWAFGACSNMTFEGITFTYTANLGSNPPNLIGIGWGSDFVSGGHSADPHFNTFRGCVFQSAGAGGETARSLLWASHIVALFIEGDCNFNGAQRGIRFGEGGYVNVWHIRDSRFGAVADAGISTQGGIESGKIEGNYFEMGSTNVCWKHSGSAYFASFSYNWAGDAGTSNGDGCLVFGEPLTGRLGGAGIRGLTVLGNRMAQPASTYFIHVAPGYIVSAALIAANEVDNGLGINCGTGSVIDGCVVGNMFGSPTHAPNAAGIVLNGVPSTDMVHGLCAGNLNGVESWVAPGKVSIASQTLAINGVHGPIMNNPVAQAGAGNLVKRQQVFDQNGTSLGYIHIYDS